MDQPRLTACTMGLHVAFTLGGITFSTGKETTYLLYDRENWVRFPAGKRDHSLHHRVQTGSEAHAASYTVGTAGLKRQRCRANHSPPPSSKVKQEWWEDPRHSSSG
jgi:hypothetical protein